MNDALAKAQAALAREDYESVKFISQPLAESGDSEAQYLMGCLFFTAAEVAKEGSREWLKRAVAQNHPQACYCLAQMGGASDFGPPESESQRQLLIRSAELGYAQAQRDLGCYYSTGAGGFPVDQRLGRHWYGRAAEQAHADAQYNFGLMVLLGEGGPKDCGAGMEWIRRAATNGDDDAITYLSQTASESAPS